MIPLELWNSDEMRKRRENAVAKALKEKPRVVLDAPGFSMNIYRVGDKYSVQTLVDPDGQYFIECNCLAGSPPIDEATGLPSREPTICYHASAVLIHIATEQEKANSDEVDPSSLPTVGLP